jgi:hypothetical protein
MHMHFTHFSNATSLGNVDLIPLIEGEGRTLKVLGFNQAQRSFFLQTLNRLVKRYLLEILSRHTV